MSKITDPEKDLRPGEEFRFTRKPANMADSLFIAVLDGEVIVTRRFTNIDHLDDDTPVIAMWHGERRTDGFWTTVGQLKAKALDWK